MAVQGRGYYGIGAEKKDFGFTKNMTLPLSGHYEWPATDGTPGELGSRRGLSGFSTVEREDGGSKSWRKRLSGLFKKKKKQERQTISNGGGASAPGYNPNPPAAVRSPLALETAPDEDDVNNRILLQQGLTEDSEEEDKYSNEAVLGDDDDSMVVAAEVELVYYDEDKDKHPEGHDTAEDNDPEVKAESTVEVEANLLDEEPELRHKEKPSSKEKKKKKNGKAAERKSAIVETTLRDDDNEMEKKVKKRRPKSMPAPSDLADELNERAETKKSVEKAATPTTKKSKRSKEVDATVSDPREAKVAESEQKAKKNGTKEKRKTTTKTKKSSEEDAFESASPPPEEEIQVPKQVTVGVIKKKNRKTRPFLNIDEASRDDQGNEREDGIDTEEQELLHDMDTLQLMADGAAAKTNDKKVRKRKQGKAYIAQEERAELEQASEARTSVKAAKKSKRSSAAESTEEVESRETKVSKRTKSKGMDEAEKQLLPAQVETTEQGAKQKKKTKKTKSKEPEAEALIQPAPQPEAAIETKKQSKKKAKGTKKKGKSKPESETPPQPEAMAEPDKKQSKKVKKAKNGGKAEPAPEAVAPVSTQEEPKVTPESKKKKGTKKSKSKEKAIEEVDAPALSEKAAAAEDEDKSKKKKKKLSKTSVGTPSSSSVQQPPSGSSSARTSRSLLGARSSKSKIASEESDDLVWIGSEKLSKKKKDMSKDDTAVDDEPENMNLSSNSRSTSYHELSKEDRKTFQEEFRKASSQHSVSASEADSIKVDIDPNVKVTKSGVVKGGKGSRRPSLQVFEDSGIDYTDNASEDGGGSGGRNNKLSMDISAVPQTTPSLGLTHGHDKLDLVYRGVSKRRPMSTGQRNSQLVQEGGGATSSPTQNHILSAHINKLQKVNGSASEGSSRQENSASLVYRAAIAKGKKTESLARQLFPQAEPQSGEGSATSTLERSRRSKSVEKPVKTLGIASENSPSSGNASPSSVPAWVALAKSKQQRSSLLLTDKEERRPIFTPSPVPAVQTTTTTTHTGASTTAASSVGGSRMRQSPADSSIPKMGTVQARLAAFERK